MHDKLKHISTRRRNERGLFDWYEYIARMMEHTRGYSFYRFQTPQIREHEDEKRGSVMGRTETNNTKQELQDGNTIL